MIDRPAVASLAIAQTVLNSLDSSLTVARNPGRTEVSELLGFLSPTEWPEALGRIGHYEVLEIVGGAAIFPGGLKGRLTASRRRACLRLRR